MIRPNDIEMYTKIGRQLDMPMKYLDWVPLGEDSMQNLPMNAVKFLGHLVVYESGSDNFFRERRRKALKVCADAMLYWCVEYSEPLTVSRCKMVHLGRENDTTIYRECGLCELFGQYAKEYSDLFSIV